MGGEGKLIDGFKGDCERNGGCARPLVAHPGGAPVRTAKGPAMSFTRVAPDLNQPVPLPDGSLNIKWTYKKGQFEDEIFPSLVELQIDNKVYVTGRVLSATDELTIPPADLAKLAGVGAVLSVLLVFHFSGEGNDLLPAGTASDLKNVAVKPWRPERIPPPPPPDPGENRRGIRVVRGADIAGVAFRPIAASWGQGRIDLFRTGGVLREVWNNGGLAHAWHDQGFHAWETVYGDSPRPTPRSGVSCLMLSAYGEKSVSTFSRQCGISTTTNYCTVGMTKSGASGRIWALRPSKRE